MNIFYGVKKNLILFLQFFFNWSISISKCRIQISFFNFKIRLQLNDGITPTLFYKKNFLTEKKIEIKFSNANQIPFLDCAY